MRKIRVLMIQVTLNDHREAQFLSFVREALLLENLEPLDSPELQFLSISLYFAGISDAFEKEVIKKC